MKIEYKILWLEDDNVWIRVPKLRIEAKIKEYGFIPIIETISDCDIDNLKYDDYDLILVDYNLNCGDDKYGNNILMLLRNRKILADAIFYSNTNTDVLYDKVKNGNIANVAIFDRGVFDDENIDQIYEIITYYLKKDLDLNSMRGIMMSEVAKFDNKMWDILLKLKNSNDIVNYVKSKKEEQRIDFEKLSDEQLWDKLNSAETSTIYFTSGERGTYLKHIMQDVLKTDNSIQDNFNIAKKYYEEIISERNQLAHREQIEQDDEEKFIALRKNIIKHRENLLNIYNKY